MPSLQIALPPELANNVIRLYRECLRRANYIGHQQHKTELLVDMVRQQFKRHMQEIDPERIQKLKDEKAGFGLGCFNLCFLCFACATKGLINHILYESEKMSGRKFSQSS